MIHMHSTCEGTGTTEMEDTTKPRQVDTTRDERKKEKVNMRKRSTLKYNIIMYIFQNLFYIVYIFSVFSCDATSFISDISKAIYLP